MSVLLLVLHLFYSHELSSQFSMEEKYTEIYRTKPLKGLYVNSIRCNGGHYFLVNMSIFEDGVFNCWGYVDLEGMKSKVYSKWISYQIPDSNHFSIHHLGRYTIKSGEWRYNNDEEYISFLSEKVRGLNPNMDNIFYSNNQKSVSIGNSNYSRYKMTNEVVVRRDGKGMSFKNYKGNRYSFFRVINEDSVDYVTVDIYQDSVVIIDGYNGKEVIDLGTFEEYIQSEKIISSLPDSSKLFIKHIGLIEILETNYSVNAYDKFREIVEDVKKMNGNQTFSELAYSLFKEYNENPSEKLRSELKEAYESIPNHLRKYVLGDMDAKDWPIRIIIYPEN